MFLAAHLPMCSMRRNAVALGNRPRVTAAAWYRVCLPVLQTHRLPSFAMLVLLVIVGNSTPAYARSVDNTVQDLQVIRTSVRDFLFSHNGSLSTPDDVYVGLIDPRLRLSPCGDVLDLFLPAGSAAVGNTTVGVRCHTPAPWLIYVPARVRLYRPVVVTTRALPRKSVLAKTDIKVERRDVGGLTAGYLDDAAQAAGRVLSRPMAIGAIVDPRALENQRLVRRGDRITIIAKAGSLTVQVAGKSLMDGASGERIRVKNLSSGRVVEGSVTGSGMVSVAR